MERKKITNVFNAQKEKTKGTLVVILSSQRTAGHQRPTLKKHESLIKQTVGHQRPTKNTHELLTKH